LKVQLQSTKNNLFSTVWLLRQYQYFLAFGSFFFGPGFGHHYRPGFGYYYTLADNMVDPYSIIDGQIVCTTWEEGSQCALRFYDYCGKRKSKVSSQMMRNASHFQMLITIAYFYFFKIYSHPRCKSSYLVRCRCISFSNFPYWRFILSYQWTVKSVELVVVCALEGLEFYHHNHHNLQIRPDI
jgi:hypothetical protein